MNRAVFAIGVLATNLLASAVLLGAEGPVAQGAKSTVAQGSENTVSPVNGELKAWRQGEWQFVESANFHVTALAAESEVASLARSCEELRKRLCDKWLGTVSDHWSPKCYVVVHPTAASYLREVGPGQQTAGSSLVELEGTKLVGRRIDLRADHAEGYQDALAHEMTHVVVAERFTAQQIPRWADEGMAVLADSAGKQAAHHRDLDRAHSGRRTFRVVQLLTLRDYPSAEQFALFYGQSASLTRFLVERGSAEQFLRFVELGSRTGYDVAAREVYQFANVAELERAWLSHLDTPAASIAVDDMESFKRMPIIGRRVALKF
jgi:hypothetical protein